MEIANIQDETQFEILKIILVGPSNTGKTTLLNQYLNLPGPVQKTLGAELHSSVFADSNMKLHLWDTAGDAKYQILTMQLMQSAFCILFFVTTDTIKDLQSNFKAVKSQAKGLKNIFLVYNCRNNGRNQLYKAKAFTIKHKLDLIVIDSQIKLLQQCMIRYLVQQYRTNGGIPDTIDRVEFIPNQQLNFEQKQTAFYTVCKIGLFASLLGLLALKIIHK